MNHLLLTLFLVLSSNAFAKWAYEPSSMDYLDINSLKFTNRATCALDSKKPATSFFLLADSMTVGKVLYRLGDKLKQPGRFSIEGVRRYRYTIFSLSKLILNRLLRGDLPLLTSELNGWEEFSKSCSGQICDSTEDFLADVWEGRRKEGSRLQSQASAYTSCHSVKEFSPLEAHLNGVKPNLDALNKIGQAVHKKDLHLKSCDSSLEEEDLKVGVYQIDLRGVAPEEWEKKGFLFWNSFKIYLSWAYRNAPEVKSLAANYSHILRQVDLEESVILFANGCTSMVAPECGKDFLNLASLRNLAQVQGAQELSKLDYFDTIPTGAKENVGDPLNPSVNNDVLHLSDYQRAPEWANNFRDNLVKTRGFYKLKLSNATAMLNLIYHNLSRLLMDKLSSHTSEALTQENRAGALKELYLLCSEYQVALDAKTSFLHNDLLKITQETSLREATRQISPDSVKQLEWFFSEFGPSVLNLCAELESKKIWENSVRPSNNLFAPWYQEFVFNLKKNAFNLKIENNIVGGPTLSIPSLKEGTICETPAHCSRKLLETILELKSFVSYASGFLALGEGIKAPALLNPMSERYACRSYDPWFKTRKTITDLLQDIVLTALSTVVPSPVYFDVSIKQRKVSSFDQILKEGKIFFDPRFEKGRIQASLIADFGPVLGAPCGLVISNKQSTTTNFLAFEGITIQACKEGERNTLNVYGPQDSHNEAFRRSGCFSCTINLASSVSSTSSFSPGIRPLVFLIRGVIRLVKNLRDPDDIPHSWEVDPNSVYRSWRRLGSVYSSCKHELTHGKECMANRCEAKLVAAFEKSFKKYVSDIAVYPGRGAEIIVKGSSTKFGVQLPTLGCSLNEYRKEDFYPLEAEE